MNRLDKTPSPIIGQPCDGPILSDIHANHEALKVVLDDIRQQDVTELFCLGDIIGYGPNPCQCLDEAMKMGPLHPGQS